MKKIVTALKMAIMRKKTKNGLSISISENMILLMMPMLRYAKVSVRPAKLKVKFHFLLFIFPPKAPIRTPLYELLNRYIACKIQNKNHRDMLAYKLK